MTSHVTLSTGRIETDERRPLAARLTLDEAMRAADWVTGKRDKAAIRDALLVNLRNTLPPGENAATQARRLAADLREPDADNRYSAILQVIRKLSRGGGAISQDFIEKILNSAAHRVVNCVGDNPE